MKALEFEARINPDNTLPIPPSVLAEVPTGQTVKILMLVPDSTEDAEWEEMASGEFLRGYAESDAIYDRLSGR